MTPTSLSFLDSHIAYIAIGSNMGDKKSTCLRSIDELVTIEGVTVEKRSSFYRSEPIGAPNQDWYVNGVVRIRTSLPPRELLAVLHLIENKLGRCRRVPLGPRTLDLDLLFYDQEIINQEGLVIPHPQAHNRSFVLMPLAEIAPRFIHPRLNLSMKYLLKNLDPQTLCAPLSEEDVTPHGAL